MVRVKKNGKWGYINKEGKLITKLQFDWAEDFRDGMARVKKLNLFHLFGGSNWGYISKRGKDNTATVSLGV